MSTVARFAEIGALIGDPARGAMIVALMGGRALTASELAQAAGVAPSTASGHLARLADAGLLGTERQGRHRYHRLASPEVARMVESVMALAAAPPACRPVRTGPRDPDLRRLRTCYDHLAGRLAVTIADRLLVAGDEDGARLSPHGRELLMGLGVRLDPHHTSVRPCLDWSERRPHLGGRLGRELLAALTDAGWIRRRAGSRAMDLTPIGQVQLRDAFGIDPV